MLCFFVCDLHGSIERYNKLFSKIEIEKPDAVFLGGDLLPSGLNLLTSNANVIDDFVAEIMIKKFSFLKTKLKEKYPRVFVILGNDDGRFEEQKFINISKEGLWEYVHNIKVDFNEFSVFGYSFIPPSPFLLKDWEKYDVSRFVDPGCVPPTEGFHTFDINKDELEFSTIKKDLDLLAGDDDLSKSIFLFHSPPYNTNLDRADLDNKMFDHVPLDVHVGSIAIERFIKSRQPLITLHGHVHESADLTGFWLEKIGKTIAINAATREKYLSLVRIDPCFPENSSRELI